MRSPNFTPLDLSDYEISPERGFLPQDPPKELPDSPALNFLGHELPKLLSARTVRRFIDEQRQLCPSIPPTWRTEDYRAAMRILSFAGHAYRPLEAGRHVTRMRTPHALQRIRDLSLEVAVARAEVGTVVGD